MSETKTITEPVKRFSSDRCEAASLASVELQPRTTLLGLSGITKRFGQVSALSDVDLVIQSGEVHCLLGENGAGKSTLCNVIFGVHQPDAGTMTFESAAYSPQGPADALAAGIAMVHQHFSVIPTMTVVENLMLGRARGLLRKADFADRLKSVARKYGFDLETDRLVSDLSVGERQRVEIVKCLVREPKLLVLDEPTAVLPPGEIAALLDICRRVAESGRSVILVTHKLAEISSVADRVTVMRGGEVVDCVSMSSADIPSLVRSMVGKEIGSVHGALAATIGVEDEPVDGPAGRDARLIGSSKKEPALRIRDVRFDDHNGTRRLDDINIAVQPGEILGIAGVQGNGQSELGNILAGLLRPTSGTISIDGKDVTGLSPREISASGVGVIPEDRHAVGCIAEMTVAENLFLNGWSKHSRFGILQRSRLTGAAARLMEEFDIRAHGPDATFQSLSGGNQQKAVLARELSIDPLVFLLAAEPTRGLDVGAIESVYGHIRSACDRGTGVLLISSELDEVIAVSDRVAVLYRGRIVGELPAEPANRERIGAMMSGHC